jgi:hypothetical protein
MIKQFRKEIKKIFIIYLIIITPILNRRTVDTALYITIMDGPILFSEFHKRFFEERRCVSLDEHKRNVYD